MPNLFSSNGNQLRVDVTDSYDAGITADVDKAIRHMPFVEAYMNFQAEKLREATGSENFEVIQQRDPNTQRPRSYVVPKNNKGIREELSKAVLLKAALGRAGQ